MKIRVERSFHNLRKKSEFSRRFIANPWYFSKETDSVEETTESNNDNNQGTTSDENSNTSQTSQVWPTTSPHLIITEAFFNKDNNRIEISNISNIPLRGNKYRLICKREKNFYSDFYPPQTVPLSLPKIISFLMNLLFLQTKLRY